MIFENAEGYADYHIPRHHLKGRRPGLSAMIRLKDEAAWVQKALESIEPFCDEIVIALQGKQSDETDRIVDGWALKSQKTIVLDYPFDSVPNGPGHDRQKIGSVWERAYFYNWCLAHTTRKHVIKWDGDMVALDWLGDALKSAIKNGKDFIRFEGIEIVDAAAMRVSATHPKANIETRVFKVTPQTYFKTGGMCEYLVGQGPKLEQHTLSLPGYLHFKWAKGWHSATNAWPDNWQEKDHFRMIAERAEPGDLYDGPIPKALT